MSQKKSVTIALINNIQHELTCTECLDWIKEA